MERCAEVEGLILEIYSPIRSGQPAVLYVPGSMQRLSRRYGASVDACWQVTDGRQHPAAVERLLRALPDWFGMTAANAEYVEAASELPACLAGSGRSCQ
jgi:hypothetical protein